MSIKSTAWEKFMATGSVMDYLNYRSIESNLLPHEYSSDGVSYEGVENEFKCDGNSDKRS